MTTDWKALAKAVALVLGIAAFIALGILCTDADVVLLISLGLAVLASMIWALYDYFKTEHEIKEMEND